MEAKDSSNEPQQSGTDSAAYNFRELISNVPLSAEGDSDGIRITCAEYWEGNLYVGTSESEILHFVSIPPDEVSDLPTYILASRTQPAFIAKQDSPSNVPGVENIQLLPSVGKACVLCNGTFSFYSLPELSPAFGGKIKQGDCTWVGGLDKNLEDAETENEDGIGMIVCLKQRLRMIQIGDKAKRVRDIELGGSLCIERRGDLACMADDRTYALLDVVNQRKIDLFPISSVAEPEAQTLGSAVDARLAASRPSSRSFSSRSPVRRPDLRGHERISSLGSEPRNIDRLMPDSPSRWPARRSSRGVTPEGSSRPESPLHVANNERPLPPPPPESETGAQQLAGPQAPLSPFVASPTDTEYLLSTGTTIDEPGVGIFVNLEGDVVRGTIEYSTYPESLVLDRHIPTTEMPVSPEDTGEGYVLAIVRRDQNHVSRRVLQVQRWDVDPGENQASKEWIALPNADDTDLDKPMHHVRLRQTSSKCLVPMPEITKALSLRKAHLTDASVRDTEVNFKRNGDEDKLIARFSSVAVRTLMWAGDSVWWITRNPLLLRLDTRLDKATAISISDSYPAVSRESVEAVFNDLRGQEPKDEFEFLTLNYVRQKAALLLMIDLITKTTQGVIAFEHDKRFTQEALIESDTDPRLVLSLIPGLSPENVEGPEGIWIPGGLQRTLSLFRQGSHTDSMMQDPRGAYGDNLLLVLKQYLLFWRRKKGFGSVADEKRVFQTVDAALLHLLLLLDKDSPRGPAVPGSLRAEINDVVDHGVDCFDRAVVLLEQHRRLYLLSRLYQNRKMIAQVLSTWRRILEGDIDEGGELIEGETDIRKYLTRIKDAALVKEYGSWLAKRNPRLGVQVFADDNARVKFTPSEAVELLKERAPGAVKEYLEHLVFGKNLVQYVNDLITFYLDTVLTEIKSSDTTRSILTESYQTYRALQPPKPTYRQFINDNAIDAEWSRNRLRLLQLIGGSHDAASLYDVASLAERLEPFSDVLVPEMIILNGRRAQHVEALRLLTHGLGDYDTAIRYCLLGGSSIFHPNSGMLSEEMLPSKGEQEVLFQHLFNEFMKIEDEAERIERTAELLERFGPWFDVTQVLGLIPDTWSVNTLSDFIVHALRRLVRERNETIIVKALSGAENLRGSADLIEKLAEFGPTTITSNQTDSAYQSMGSQQS